MARLLMGSNPDFLPIRKHGLVKVRLVLDQTPHQSDPPSMRCLLLTTVRWLVDQRQLPGRYDPGHVDGVQEIVRFGCHAVPAIESVSG